MMKNGHVYALRERVRGRILVYCFNVIQSINHLFGRKSLKLNSKWHIWTSLLTIWRKQFNMHSVAEQQLRMRNFPKIGELCLTPTDTLFAYAK